MIKNININKGSTNILGLLGVAFVILKLCNVIDWSWLLVTLPFWGIPSIILLVMIAHILIVVFKK